MTNEKSSKIEWKFHCETCHYRCRYKSDYNKHIMTLKHKIRTNTNEKSSDDVVTIKSCEFCGKTYKHASSLWNHKVKCKKVKIEENMKKEEEIINEEVYNDNSLNYIKSKTKENNTTFSETKKDEDDLNYKTMFLTMMKKNDELQQTLIDIIPKIGNNNTNTTHNNFNLQVFLNEQCKDAITLMDFVNSLQVEFSQIEYTGVHGFVEGVSNIFTKAIQNMDVTKRPIHCTDLKREILYVKDDESWNKDGENKEKMKLAIDKIKHHNLVKMSEWIKENPECYDSSSAKNDLFVSMVHANTNENEKDMKKVIKSIAKSSMIPKKMIQ